MIWWGIVVYVLLGAVYSIEAAARLDAWDKADDGVHPWRPDEYILIALAALFWPLALLGMAWYAGFEWRAEQIRKRIVDARG